MINSEKTIHDLTRLGRVFESVIQGSDHSANDKMLNVAIEQAYLNNPWFIPSFVRFTLVSPETSSNNCLLTLSPCIIFLETE